MRKIISMILLMLCALVSSFHTGKMGIRAGISSQTDNNGADNSRAISSHSKDRTRSNSKLLAWGLQKLGQPVGINVEQTSETVKQTPFGGHQTTGSGIDERKVRHDDGVTDNKDWEMIASMDGSFRRKSLLMSLESEDLSSFDKVERIQMAAKQDGLLPQSFGSSITRTCMSAAGLTDDWNFEM
jgi:hypothetical protein